MIMNFKFQIACNSVPRLSPAFTRKYSNLSTKPAYLFLNIKHCIHTITDIQFTRFTLQFTQPSILGLPWWLSW